MIVASETLMPEAPSIPICASSMPHTFENTIANLKSCANTTQTQQIHHRLNHNGSLSWSPRRYAIRLLARLQADRLHPALDLPPQLQVRATDAASLCGLLLMTIAGSEISSMSSPTVLFRRVSHTRLERDVVPFVGKWTMG